MYSWAARVLGVGGARALVVVFKQPFQPRFYRRFHRPASLCKMAMDMNRRQRHNSVSGDEQHVMGGHVEGILFAIGNPLLDISAEVSEDFLKKYSLEANNSILADPKHLDLCADMVKNYNVDYVPGGATQNSIRIAQWLIGVPNATTFMGCIGRDEYGKILESKVREAGVNPRYMYHDKEPTGTCAVCLTGTNRSLVAYLGAANYFNKAHLDIPSNRALIEKAQYFYMAGFPLTVCPDAMLDVAKFAAANDRLFAMNLSAPFLCSCYRDQMKCMLPYVDILFGNELEAEAYAEANSLPSKELSQVAMQLARLPKENGKRGRMVVFTQGAKPTIVIQEGRILEFPVIPISEKAIVDTNGAGDAFVGGFLAQMVQGGALEDCIRSANYAANYIIQQSGCQLPDKPNFSRDSVGF